MKKSTKRSFLVLMFIICLLIFLCVFAETSITSKSQDIIKENVKAAVEMEISRIVYDNIKELNTNSKSLMTYEKDQNGRIIAIKSDPYFLERLKSAVLYNLNKTSLDNRAFDVEIPVGTLLSSSLLLGRGPNIRIRVNPAGSFSAKTLSEFVSAGINQTKHKVTMNISATLLVLVPFGEIKTSISSDVLISETVIVGTVPDYMRAVY